MQELAKRIVDANLESLRQIVSTVSPAIGDATAIAAIKPGLVAMVNAMADVEESLVERLSDQDLESLKGYALPKLGVIYDGAYQALQALGLMDGIDQASYENIKRALRGDQPLAVASTKFCRCIGVIISHRECCANGAGNGVCLGLWTCGAHVVSDSCPPV